MLELITTIAAILLLILTIFGIVNELNKLEMRIKNLEKDLGKDPQGPRFLEARTGEQINDLYERLYKNRKALGKIAEEEGKRIEYYSDEVTLKNIEDK